MQPIEKEKAREKRGKVKVFGYKESAIVAARGREESGTAESHLEFPGFRGRRKKKKKKHYFFLRMSEPPFRPREKLIEKQKYFQSVHKHTYLKGPYDKITSVAIPVALAASSLYLIVQGIYNMSHGIGKKE
ncbi:hypothetical protein DITRI_Ditri05aG0053300 [Diplodiscus trichospermus]